MPVISGSYFGYYNSPVASETGALALGHTRTGFRHSHSFSSREINFDVLGTAPADVLFTGWQVFVDFVLQEYDAAAVNTLHWHFPSGQPLTEFLGTSSPAGGSLWDRAKPLKLKSCTGAPPAVRYYPKAILAPNFSVDIDFAHTERAVPIRMMILPVAYESDPVDLETPNRPVGCEKVLYWRDIATP